MHLFLAMVYALEIPKSWDLSSLMNLPILRVLVLYT